MKFDKLVTDNNVEIYTYNNDDTEVFCCIIDFNLGKYMLDDRSRYIANVYAEALVSRMSSFTAVKGRVDYKIKRNVVSFYCSLTYGYLHDMVSNLLKEIYKGELFSEKEIDEANLRYQASRSRLSVPSAERLSSLEESSFLKLHSADCVDVDADKINRFAKALTSSFSPVVYLAGRIFGVADWLPELANSLIGKTKPVDCDVFVPISYNDWRNLSVRSDEVVAKQGLARFDYIFVLQNKLNHKDEIVFSVLTRILNSNSNDSFYSTYRGRGLAYTLFYDTWPLFISGLSLFALYGVADSENIDAIVELFKSKLTEVCEVLRTSDITSYREFVHNRRSIDSLQTPEELVLDARRRYDLADNITWDDHSVDNINNDDIVYCIDMVLNPAKEILFKVAVK